MLGRSLGNLEGQDFGFNRDGRVLVSVGPAGAVVHGCAAHRALPRRGGAARAASRACRAWGWRSTTRSRTTGARACWWPASRRRRRARETGSSWDRVSANYLQHLGVKLVRGRHFTDGRQRDLGERRGGERGLRAALLQAGGGSARSALRAEPARERQHLPHRRAWSADARFAGVPARPAGPADVLRAARPDGELRQRDDEARGDRVALRRRTAAGDQHAARRAGAAGGARAGGGGSQPGGHQHPHPASSRSSGRSTSRARWRAWPDCSASWR